jgi:hypothetical protein
MLWLVVAPSLSAIRFPVPHQNRGKHWIPQYPCGLPAFSNSFQIIHVFQVGSPVEAHFLSTGDLSYHGLLREVFRLFPKLLVVSRSYRLREAAAHVSSVRTGAT